MFHGTRVFAKPFARGNAESIWDRDNLPSLRVNAKSPAAAIIRTAVPGSGNRLADKPDPQLAVLRAEILRAKRERWRGEHLQITGCRQEIGKEGIGKIPSRGGIAKPILRQLIHPNPNQVIDGKRFVARNWRARGL